MVHEKSASHFLNGNVQSDLEARGPNPDDGLEARSSSEHRDAHEHNTIDSAKISHENSILRPDEETRKSSRLRTMGDWVTWKKLEMVDSDVESRDGVMIEGDSDEEFVSAKESKTVNQVVSGMPNQWRGNHVRSGWLNILWLLLATLFLPAGLAGVWFGILPIGGVGNTLKEEALWMFIVNPGVYLTFSFAIVQIFLGCLDDKPWQLLKHYIPVLVVNYVLQVGVIGAAVHTNKGTFQFLGLVALLISISVTLVGLRMTPTKHFGRNKTKFVTIFHQLVRLMAAFVAFYCILLGYILASSRCTSNTQGFLTVALSILTSAWKKAFVHMTDFFHVEIVILIAGLWLENLANVFISLTLVTATRLGPTFTVIFITWVLEDIGHMLSWTNKWCSICNWVKDKWNTNPGQVDARASIDRSDRYDSNRCFCDHGRNARFLAWKLLSQLSSIIVFLSVVPILRVGHNQEFYPFGDSPLTTIDGMINRNALKPFGQEEFEKSVVFSGSELMVFFALALSLAAWTWRNHRKALNEMMSKFSFLIVSNVDFGLMVAILASNVLLGVSAFQVPNRLYFL